MLGMRQRPPEPPSEAPSASGRRREALLRGDAGPGQAPGLTPEDVHALQQDRSPDKRAMVAAKLGRQLDELSRGSGRDLAHAVLELLVRDMAKEVRQALAQAVASSPSLPPSTALRLARDDIDVARPLLEHSPILDDEALIGVVRANAMQYALAVASREGLSEAVSAALVETGQQPVVVRLVGNVSARLSRQTLERIVEEYRGVADVQDRLVRRPELPYEVVEQLVGVIGDRLEWDLVRTRRMPPDEARRLMSAVRERAAIGLAAREHSERTVMQRLRERFTAGELSHEELLRCLKRGDVAGLELGLALHARLEPGRVRRLLYHPDRRHMVALCVAAGFPTAHYVMLRMALDLAEAALGSPGQQAAYSEDTVRFLQHQYERLRDNEPRLMELLDA